MTSLVRSTFLASCLAAAGSMLASPDASASLYTAHNGSECKGSSGFGAQYFYFPGSYAENTTSSLQYITCVMPMIRNDATAYPTDGSQGMSLSVQLVNSSGANAASTCAVEMRYPNQSAGNVVTSVKTVTVLAGGQSIMQFTPADLPIRNGFIPVNLTCGLPAGFRLGFVDMFQPAT